MWKAWCSGCCRPRAGRSTVQGIGIGFTGNVTAERVAVRDEAGEWLVIEDFGLDWRPLSLFTDTLAHQCP
jgi:autotransporter translocation and assembly factor TamB